MKEINRNWTKGKSTFDKQKGKPGHCFVAQVWKEDGSAICNIEPTQIAKEASANAALFCDALNIANKTGLTPSELLKQRDDIINSIGSLPASDSFAHINDLATLIEKAANILEIHANNEGMKNVFVGPLLNSAKRIREAIANAKNIKI